MLTEKINFLSVDDYTHLKISQIYLSYEKFLNQKSNYRKKLMPKNKNKKINKNQGSFYFEEYLNTKTKFNNNKLSSISEDRVYLLFFCFVSLILIFSLKIIFLSFQSVNYVKNQMITQKFLPLRKDIVDRNGVLLSRNILTYHAAIRPQLIKDKKIFS